MSDLVCVQYGAGLSAPEGWISFDNSPTLRLQRVPVVGSLAPGPKFPKATRVGDVLRGLPVSSGSVDRVYCSHVLEHLSLTDCRKAIRETYRVLKPGGVFRAVQPDLLPLCQKVVEGQADPEAAHEFMRRSVLGYETRRRGLKGVAIAVLGNSRHMWMWTEAALKKEFEDAGFVDVRRASFGDSGEAVFEAVEAENRWEGHLGLHCVKPSGG
ncbi:MAG: methyltransferase domain-containing protein [Planctomycetota bacterium]